MLYHLTFYNTTPTTVEADNPLDALFDLGNSDTARSNRDLFAAETLIAFATWCMLEGILPGKITSEDVQRWVDSRDGGERETVYG